VADVVKPFFLFFPLGALLAVWPLRRRGALGYCLPAIYLAVITEIGQGFVEGRFFDGTDLLIQCAAAAIGWLVVRSRMESTAAPGGNPSARSQIQFLALMNLAPEPPPLHACSHPTPSSHGLKESTCRRSR
jgi:peptidoglycan/LPS O-acetylase OafA/YrhL